MRFIIVFFVLFISGTHLAQPSFNKEFYLIDSLDLKQFDQFEIDIIKKHLTTYHKTNDIVKKIEALNAITQESNESSLWTKYNDIIIKQCEAYLANEENLEHRKQISKFYATGLNDIGFFYSTQGKLDKAIAYYKKGLMLSIHNNDAEGEALAYNNLGGVYDAKGDVLSALKNYYKSLAVAKKSKQLDMMALCYSNIGVMYDQQEDFANALEHYKKSLNIQLKINDKSGMATSYNNIGFAYYKIKDYKHAIYYYNLSKKNYNAINEKSGVATALGNIGNVYLDEGDLVKSLYYFKRSLRYDLAAKNLHGVSLTYSSIADVHFQSNDLMSAKKYALDAHRIAEEIGSPELYKASSRILSEIYKKEENWPEAYKMQSLYYQMKDSVSNKRNQKELITLGLKDDFEKEKSLAKKENEKKLAISKEEKQKQRLILYFTFGILFVVILFLVIIANRFRLTTKQKIIIEEKNKEITDSITYAKRIQSAILPQLKIVKEYFKDSFILYKPKDIVAGDFYWFEVIDDTIFFAAADCTGHGVPGAMVSVVCHNALNRSVKEFNLKSPAEILDKTREIVITEFEKSDEDVKDGMDISLCVINQKNNTLSWSGAHNPLWILRNKKIIEYKADKQPIGKFAHSKPFTNHEIEIMEKDEIYIATDGYQDQFGGEKAKKFKASQLKELLIENADKSMEEKKELIDQTFESWKNKLDQVDDVCVIGFKI